MELPFKTTEPMYQIIRDVVFWIESDLSRPLTSKIVAHRAGTPDSICNEPLSG